MGDPVQLNGSEVTANYFDLFGVKPIRGRLFLPQEEMKADVALVSANFWRNRLGSDPNVIGRSITLNGVADHDRRRVAEHADRMVRTERGSLDDETVRARRTDARTTHARRQFHARRSGG